MSNSNSFPNVPIPAQPMGIFVLVQVERPAEKIGSIYISDDARDSDQYMKDRGMVRAVGTNAYHYRQGGEWPGYPEAYAWPGDYVRFPKYSGAAIWQDYTETDPDGKKTKVSIKFLVIQDNEILAKEVK